MVGDESLPAISKRALMAMAQKRIFKHNAEGKK